MALVGGCAATSSSTPVTPEGPRAPGLPYRATGIPDRILLTPGADPARQMAVAFRTDARQRTATGELARALAGPTLAPTARAVTGVSSQIVTENGDALYHQVRFEGLDPDTAYVYRVRGADGWSEWIPFRTASAEAKPFRFIYFGDTQNSILDRGSRTIRQAFARSGGAALAVHAGDLVASRDDMSHDDEWGEWTASGGFHFAMTPQIPAPGNHEYVDVVNADGTEGRKLAPHWPLQFALPGNGAERASATTYFVDYQGVRFVVLDGTAAIDLGAIESQSAWLDKTLADAGDRWTVVLMHQPIFTCARPQDTEPLKARWRPIFETRGVDLVLQGHDHCYGRWADPPQPGAPSLTADRRTLRGPVYVVSVTGAKMYGLNDRVRTQADRWAEDTQLFQVIDVAADRLTYAAYTADGAPYDAFDLLRGSEGNTLVQQRSALSAPRTCTPTRIGPDGQPCTAEPKD